MSDRPHGPDWYPNKGAQPRGSKGKRVDVILACETGAPYPPRSWPCDGKQGCRWDLSGHPFDIAWYRKV